VARFCRAKNTLSTPLSPKDKLVVETLISWWIDSPYLRMAVGFVALVAVMFLVRTQAHAFILRFARAVRSQLRLLARFCLRIAQRMRLRNYEVTRALAEQLLQRRIEKEFMRIESMVVGDLANYQRMAASINRQLDTINRDYEESMQVPPAPPQWIEAVDALAALEHGNQSSEVLSRILSDMHETIREHQREAMREHRWTVSSRHKILAGLRPKWSRLNKLLATVDNKMDALAQRLKQVDQHMGRYEMMASNAGYGFMSSVLVRFILSVAFCAAGVIAAVALNSLVAAPLSGLLGELSLLGLAPSTYATLLIISMLLFSAALLFESLRITHLLPLMAAISRKGRLMLLWGSGLGVSMLALLSAGLASGYLVAPDQGLQPPQVAVALLTLSTALVVAVSIVPLEYFIYTLRPVVSSALQMLLHGMAFALRMLSAMVMEVGRLLLHIYDLVIFIPLKVSQERSQKRPVDLTAEAEAAQQADEPIKPQLRDEAKIRRLDFSGDRGKP
jgi:hypothetical protein